MLVRVDERMPLKRKVTNDCDNMTVIVVMTIYLTMSNEMMRLDPITTYVTKDVKIELLICMLLALLSNALFFPAITTFLQ